MALFKQRELESGAVGNYWRIASVNISRDGAGVWHAFASLLLYKDAEARAAGRPFMHQESQKYVYDTKHTGAAIIQAYEALKNEPLFQGAVDC